STRREKDMVCTVRALVRDPFRRSRGRVARGVLWIVVCRDRGGDCGADMTGRQACLRTVEEENQEQEHRQRGLAEPMHEVRLTCKRAHDNTEGERTAARSFLPWGRCHSLCRQNPTEVSEDGTFIKRANDKNLDKFALSFALSGTLAALNVTKQS